MFISTANRKSCDMEELDCRPGMIPQEGIIYMLNRYVCNRTRNLILAFAVLLNNRLVGNDPLSFKSHMMLFTSRRSCKF